jgi:hypothetical protein
VNPDGDRPGTLQRPADLVEQSEIRSSAASQQRRSRQLGLECSHDMIVAGNRPKVRLRRFLEGIDQNRQPGRIISGAEIPIRASEHLTMLVHALFPALTWTNPDRSKRFGKASKNFFTNVIWLTEDAFGAP